MPTCAYHILTIACFGLEAKELSCMQNLICMSYRKQMSWHCLAPNEHKVRRKAESASSYFITLQRSYHFKLNDSLSIIVMVLHYLIIMYKQLSHAHVVSYFFRPKPGYPSPTAMTNPLVPKCSFNGGWLYHIQDHISQAQRTRILYLNKSWC